MANVNEFQPRLFEVPAAVALSADSGMANMGGCQAVAIRFPSAFTGTLVQFAAVDASGAAFTLTDAAGVPFSIVAAPGTQVPLDPDVMAGVQTIKFVGNALEEAGRTVTILGRP